MQLCFFVEVCTNSLVYFFNDIIGTVLPGFVLLSGLKILNKKYAILEIPNLQLDNFLQGFSILALSYILGHGLLGLHKILKKISDFIKSKLRGQKQEKNKPEQDALFQDLIKCFSDRFSSLGGLRATIDPQKYSQNQIRNIAMTISKEGQKVSVRFRFISLLCIGVATALFILLFVFVISHILKYRSDFISTKFVLFSVAMSFGIYIFYDRGQEFSKRSFRTPFATALSELMFDKTNEKSNSK